MIGARASVRITIRMTFSALKKMVMASAERITETEKRIQKLMVCLLMVNL